VRVRNLRRGLAFAQLPAKRYESKDLKSVHAGRLDQLRRLVESSSAFAIPADRFPPPNFRSFSATCGSSITV
jgi:hypothetical protein